MIETKTVLLKNKLYIMFSRICIIYLVGKKEFRYVSDRHSCIFIIIFISNEFLTCKYASVFYHIRNYVSASDPTVAIVAGVVSGIVVVACVLIIVYLKRRGKV